MTVLAQKTTAKITDFTVEINTFWGHPGWIIDFSSLMERELVVGHIDPGS